jgi:hypothetical protein
MGKQQVVHKLSRELEPLECDHEWKTVERDKEFEFQICVVCDEECTIERRRYSDDNDDTDKEIIAK